MTRSSEDDILKAIQQNSTLSQPRDILSIYTILGSLVTKVDEYKQRVTEWRMADKENMERIEREINRTLEDHGTRISALESSGTEQGMKISMVWAGLAALVLAALELLVLYLAGVLNFGG